VGEGSVTLEGSLTVSRLDALAWGVLDGLDEFRTFVEKYSADLDASEYHSAYRASAFYLWTLGLRKGAHDRADAMRLQAQWLQEMNDLKFSDFMQNDGALGQATMYVFGPSCKGQQRTSEACRSFALIAARQRELLKKRQEAHTQALAVGGNAVHLEEPDWLGTMTEQTNAAWVKLVQENTRRVQLENKKP
jgi:hypothetical protein